MVAVKSFAALSSAGAHDAHDVSKTVDSYATRMSLPPQVAQHANAEPMPERLRAALDTGWRGKCRAPCESGAMAHARRAADC